MPELGEAGQLQPEQLEQTGQLEQGGPTGDPGVDALVALAAQAAQLPAGEHQGRYIQVLAGLERELDADPGAAMRAPYASQGAAAVQGNEQ